MRTGAIKATRPGPETPAPAYEVDACPKCGRKSNVRVLPGKSRYCTGCDLEFKTAKPAAVTRGRPRKHVVRHQGKAPEACRHG
ncbi:MAG: hypothetical protein K6T29_06965 [Peptococcaceae bacterium]|nr:hypothetical protein [Peptococcaceae bacterium]